jgi:hypothetical protein
MPCVHSVEFISERFFFSDRERIGQPSPFVSRRIHIMQFRTVMLRLPYRLRAGMLDSVMNRSKIIGRSTCVVNYSTVA